MNLKGKLWNWKGFLILFSIIAITLGILIGIWNAWGGFFGFVITIVVPNVIFNWKTLKEFKESLVQTIRVGWKQMKISQLEKEEQIKRLVNLEQHQYSNIDHYLRTFVSSVSYRNIRTTAPCIIITVEFLNLLLNSCKLLSWKLVIDNTDTSQLNCKQKNYQLRSQCKKINDDIDIEATSSRKVDLVIDVPDVVGKAIEELPVNRDLLQYGFHIHWALDLGEKGTHTYKDYLSYVHIPNLNM